MVLAGCVFLVLFCFRANSLPLSTQLSEEEEKVSKCIMEVLADTLSNPIPAQISSDCRRILKEDERIVSMLHHQHLMRELEDLNHRENSKHRFGQEGGHGGWEEQGEDSDEDEIKKRNQEAGAAHQRDPEKRGTDSSGKEVKTEGGKSKREHEDVKEFEKTEKIEEKVKEEKVSHAEDDTKVRMEEAKELLEDEDEEDEDKKKRNAPGKRSREHFEDDKRREHEKGNHGEALNEILERLSKDAHQANKKMADVKKHFSDEDSSEEENFHHGGFHEGHHGGHHREHENWEDEEEEEKKSGPQQRSVRKRVDEKASDEETAQFEAEEKGVKISNMKSHLHGSHVGGHLSEKPWEDKRNFHNHESDSEEELRKRHHEEDPYLKKHLEDEEEREEDEEEMEEKEAAKKEGRELENLEDIEYELKKAAEKLRELHRG
ncbi:coiled-coil domain-containing glutamate-rich protein 2 [Lissotriton helveticus]